MIPVYKYEHKDGLSKAVANNTSVAYTSQVKSKILNDEEKKIFDKIVANSTFGANSGQIDLYYLESVLASIGWNSNDDVFDRKYTWAARHTPVDKQFNYMHDEKDIIGHITASRVLDAEGNEIDDDTKFEDLPEFFDVVVGSVLYRRWSDKDLQTRMDTVIAEIDDGKWFVSMEALFANFDYSLIDKDGNQKVVARNDESSFLTKHLRAYGGTGEYNNYKLGRMLKDYVFSGKGLVNNPANKRSDIINAKASSNKTVIFNGQSTSVENIKSENKIMSDTVSVAEYDAVKAELAKVKAAKDEATQKEINSLNETIASLTDSNKTKADELSNAKSLSEEKDEKIVALETQVTELTSAKEEVEAKVQEMEAKAIKSARASKLVEAGLDSEKATELVEKFATANDEMFDEVVELHKSKVEAAKDFEKKDKKEDKKDDKKDMKKKDEKTDASDSKSDIETDLEDAKASDDADLTDTNTEEGETELIRASASSWFANNWSVNKPKTQEKE